VQVELPPPPPMRYVPGMAEPLVATGEVTEAEGKDLNAALKEFHDAPAKAGPGGDFTDYEKPLLAFMDAHSKSNWNASRLWLFGGETLWPVERFPESTLARRNARQEGKSKENREGGNHETNGRIR